jgi:hypothetical protein
VKKAPGNQKMSTLVLIRDRFGVDHIRRLDLDSKVDHSFIQNRLDLYGSKDEISIKNLQKEVKEGRCEDVVSHDIDFLLEKGNESIDTFNQISCLEAIDKNSVSNCGSISQAPQMMIDKDSNSSQSFDRDSKERNEYDSIKDFSNSIDKDCKVLYEYNSSQSSQSNSPDPFFLPCDQIESGSRILDDFSILKKHQNLSIEFRPSKDFLQDSSDKDFGGFDSFLDELEEEMEQKVGTSFKDLDCFEMMNERLSSIAFNQTETFNQTDEKSTNDRLLPIISQDHVNLRLSSIVLNQTETFNQTDEKSTNDRLLPMISQDHVNERLSSIAFNQTETFNQTDEKSTNDRLLIMISQDQVNSTENSTPHNNRLLPSITQDGSQVDAPTPQNDRFLPPLQSGKDKETPQTDRNITDIFSPGSFFASRSGEMGNLGDSSIRPTWYTPKHDKNGRMLDPIGLTPVKVEKVSETPAGKRVIRAPLYTPGTNVFQEAFRKAAETPAGKRVVRAPLYTPDGGNVFQEEMQKAKEVADIKKGVSSYVPEVESRYYENMGKQAQDQKKDVVLAYDVKQVKHQDDIVKAKEIEKYVESVSDAINTIEQDSLDQFDWQMALDDIQQSKITDSFLSHDPVVNVKYEEPKIKMKNTTIINLTSQTCKIILNSPHKTPAYHSLVLTTKTPLTYTFKKISITVKKNGQSHTISDDVFKITKEKGRVNEEECLGLSFYPLFYGQFRGEFQIRFGGKQSGVVVLEVIGMAVKGGVNVGKTVGMFDDTLNTVSTSLSASASMSKSVGSGYSLESPDFDANKPSVNSPLEDTTNKSNVGSSRMGSSFGKTSSSGSSLAKDSALGSSFGSLDKVTDNTPKAPKSRSLDATEFLNDKLTDMERAIYLETKSPVTRNEAFSNKAYQKGRNKKEHETPTTKILDKPERRGGPNEYQGKDIYDDNFKTPKTASNKIDRSEDTKSSADSNDYKVQIYKKTPTTNLKAYQQSETHKTPTTTLKVYKTKEEIYKNEYYKGALNVEEIYKSDTAVNVYHPKEATSLKEQHSKVQNIIRIASTKHGFNEQLKTPISKHTSTTETPTIYTLTPMKPNTTTTLDFGILKTGTTKKLHLKISNPTLNSVIVKFAITGVFEILSRELRVSGRSFVYFPVICRAGQVGEVEERLMVKKEGRVQLIIVKAVFEI